MFFVFVFLQQFSEEDFLDDTLRESTSKTSKDVAKSENHDVEHDISSHRSTDGIQRGLALCDQGQPAKNRTQGQSTGCERVTELPVTEIGSIAGQSGVNDPLGQNVEGTYSHSNIIPFREDTGSKADSDCQVACSPTAINQALSLPSFPASPYSNNLKSDLINSTAAMFTSTLVSVLGPNWSGRLRRHKRGFSDVGTDIAQNTILPTLSQNEQQQRFPLQQIPTRGEPVNDFSSRLRGSGGTSRSSDEWQNESFSHLSESKKMFLKTSFLRMNRHEVDQTAEFGNRVHVSVDSSEVPRSTLSLQLSDYRRTAQSVDQGESFSSLRSRPTTSTLLLSSRRSNSRKPSPESFQMQKQLSASISSLNLPSQNILRISQPQPTLVSPNDPAKETKNILASPEQLSATHKPNPFSKNWGEMDSSRKQRYLITGDFDMVNRTPATNDTTRQMLFSNYTTRFNHSETLKSVQDHGAVDRRVTDNTNLQDSNSKIPERSAWISPKENANSRFVFPQFPSNLNSDSILKRRISKTSMTSTDLGPSTSVQSNSISNMINSNKTSTISNTTSPRTIQSIATSPSVSLTPAPLIHADQSNIQNSSGSEKPSSSPVNSIRMKTFTESLSFSPRNSSLEGTSPSHLWSNHLNSKRQPKESNQSPLDQPSPLSPSDFKPRRVCTPSIYKYLRESSSPKSTRASPALSSPSPQTSSLKQIQEEDKNSRNLWFIFDSSLVESYDPLLKPDTSSTSSPQSMPPDTGRRSVSHLSKSPYSTLISTRAAINSLSSPPVTRHHSRSFSYGSLPVDPKSPKVEKRSYTSVLRDRMSKRKSSLGEPVGSTDIQINVKAVSIHQDGISKSSTDAKFPDCQASTLIPDATHPKQTDTLIRNIPHEGLNGIFLSQGEKSNTYATDSLNSKELSLPLGTAPVSEAVQKGRVTEILQTNGTFQASQSPNSKRSLFSLRSKKDNVLTSSSSTDKEGLAVKKAEMTGLKTPKRVDQMLNRLKLKFGGKVSEDSDMTSRRKTKKEEASNVKAYESIKKEKESDDLTVQTKMKPEELLESKAFERNKKLDQMEDLTVKRQMKPEESLNSKAPERSISLDQTDDLTVRRKTNNETSLDIMTSETKKKIEHRFPSSQTLKSPNSPDTQVTFMIESCNSSGPVLGFSYEQQDRSPNMDEQERLMEELRDGFLGRPLSLNSPKPDHINCYATLPPGKRSRLVPSPTLSPFECSSEDEQNDNVFSVLTKGNDTSLGEPENVAQPDNVVQAGGQNSTGVVLSSPCADLKYGLKRGRSVSVSSVVSGRPSGPGRISTGSRQGSVSDLSSLDGFVTKSRHSSINSPVGSPEKDVTASSGHMSYKGPTRRSSSEGHHNSTDIPEAISFSCDMEADPTPPPSPPHSRRISQTPSPTSASNKTSPDSLSPRGFLPSRNYKSMLSVFEESGSETTTDDEYYLNSDDEDEKETEL